LRSTALPSRIRYARVSQHAQPVQLPADDTLEELFLCRKRQLGLASATTPVFKSTPPASKGLYATIAPGGSGGGVVPGGARLFSAYSSANKLVK
jgi:hypothetical protein